MFAEPSPETSYMCSSTKLSFKHTKAEVASDSCIKPAAALSHANSARHLCLRSHDRQATKSLGGTFRNYCPGQGGPSATGTREATRRRYDTGSKHFTRSHFLSCLYNGLKVNRLVDHQFPEAVVQTIIFNCIVTVEKDWSYSRKVPEYSS